MDHHAKIARNGGTTKKCDVIENIDMERDSMDVEIYGVVKIFKVAENDGDVENYRVSKIFESINSHEEDSNTSYSDANLPTNNQETSSLEHDMSLDEMEKVLSLASILIEEMSIYGCFMPMLDHTIKNSCRVHPFELNSKVSCLEFLLAWEISIEGRYDLEHASLRLDGEDTLVDDNNEPFYLKGMLMIEFSNSKEPK